MNNFLAKAFFLIRVVPVKNFPANGTSRMTAISVHQGLGSENPENSTGALLRMVTVRVTDTPAAAQLPYGHCSFYARKILEEDIIAPTSQKEEQCQRCLRSRATVTQLIKG